MLLAPVVRVSIVPGTISMVPGMAEHVLQTGVTGGVLRH